ncbi:MAG: VIT domain-containing protein [Candidatus Hodarchaeales archaeon]|jgi:uncharacterized protein YegL
MNSITKATATDGSGFMVVINPQGQEINPEITLYNVSVSINKNYATTEVYEEFVNPHDEPVSGTYYFGPIPDNSLISNFSLTIDDITYYAECKPLEQAKEEFEEAKEEGRDAAILEFEEPNIFSYSVSIAANSTLGVGIEYEQLLDMKHGNYTYKYALDLSGQGSSDVIDNVNLEFVLEGGNQRINSLNTDFSDLSEQVISDYRRELTYHAEQLIPSNDFVVDYQLEVNGSHGNLMTYTRGNERYFLYSLAPELEEINADTYLGKNIIFVVDVSGSMAGTKMEQVKQALSSIVQNLNDNDKFNILPYDTIVTKFKETMVVASIANIQQSLTFIQGLQAIGSTNINDALVTAMDQFTEDLPGLNLVIFMTDGQPTAGITDTETIVSNVIDHNDHSATIFSFGFGTGLNFDLLERVSHTTRQTGGEAYQIDPSEVDIDIELEDFYRTVENPLMTRIVLKFLSQDAGINETVPTTSAMTTHLETLFHGSEKIVTGMMNASVKELKVNISALVGNQEVFTVENIFNLTESESTDLIERLHVNRRIKSLLDIVPYITNEQLLNATVSEIVIKALKYGFVTPYTALLVDPSIMPPVEEKIGSTDTTTTVIPTYATTYTRDTILNYAPVAGYGMVELLFGLVIVIMVYKKKRAC